MTELHPDGGVQARTGRVRAGATVLAVNSARGRLPRLPPLARGRVEPHRPHGAGPGRHRGARVDGRRGDRRRRTLVHYTRTTRDGRIVFGWGGGRMGLGDRRSTRLERDADVVARTRESLVRFFPQLEGREITHAWGGPIDVSPTHIADLREPRPRAPRLRVHGERRRAVVSRRADPRAARARHARRADRAPDRRAAAQALPARAVSLGRRLAHPPRAVAKDAAEDAGRSPCRAHSSSSPRSRGGSVSGFRGELESR